MAYSSSNHETWYTRVDVIAAIVGLAMALAMFPLRFVASQVYVKTIPIVLGVACGLYLLAVRADRRRGTGTSARRQRGLPTLPSGLTMALPSVVLLGLAAMVLLTALQGTRTPLFFGLSSVVATLVLGQIVFADERDFHGGLLLFQIVCFAFVFRFTALYATPGLIGIDAWTHITNLAESIYAAESVSGIADDKHYASPFYHLLVVASALLYDVSLITALYLSVGVVMPLSILLVYATTHLLVPQRWAVLATGLYAVASYVSHWGIHIIPTSMGLVFFLGVLYALVRVMRIEYATRDFGLLVLLTVAVILTHQVSTFIMLVVLVAAFLAQLVFVLSPFEVGYSQLETSVFRAQKPVNLVGLVVFDLGLTIFMWSLTPFREESFLATVLSWLHSTLVDSAGFLNLAGPSDDGGGEAAEAASAGPTLLEQVVQYVDVLGFLVLLGAMFVGCLYVVRRKRAEQSVVTLLFAAAIMLVFVLGLPMFGIRNFIPTRWFAFLYVPMVIFAAIGLRHLVTTVDARVVFACLLVVVLVYPGAMIFAAESNADQPVFPDQHERLAYDEDELAAVSTIGEMAGEPRPSEMRPDQVLYTDHPYQTVLKRTHAHHADTATVADGEPVDHDVTLHRSTDAGATYYRDANGFGQARDIPETRLCRSTQATVYTNGDVSLCVASPAT
ncbi:hypothetical protein [Natronoglomus mannanivorans]|uniref:Dolichyl-phosphate-mannose-protein mannosyltransferase n=1 Tax=Natronoglomus mannanivorans TaxID=2979990 RepID=A0AAP2Z148_9EURY|nr:hypothetical protein [Halobacteria archaeon AArc-xg1-1]